MLTTISGFFADMFTVGEPSSSTQSSEEQTIDAMLDKSDYKSRSVSPTTIPISPIPFIDYPGPHDFVVVASDGVRFNLSRTMLAATSGFFADMFTLGEPEEEEQTTNASEHHVILDALFAISYSHPEKPIPEIVTFAQIAELIRVAEKYRMRHALNYLSSHLMLPRIQGTTAIPPFTVTHPLATLSLSLTHGFSLPARVALREVVNVANFIWDTTSDDATLEGFTIDFRVLKMIHMIRKSRADAYKGFIEKLQPVPKDTSRILRPTTVLRKRPAIPPNSQPECVTCVQDWKADLLKKFKQAPNSAAFSVAFYEGWVCGRCGQSLMTCNLVAFKAFIALRATEEHTLPELP